MSGLDQTKHRYHGKSVLLSIIHGPSLQPLRLQQLRKVRELRGSTVVSGSLLPICRNLILMDENLLALWYWNTALDDDALFPNK